jgi:hypothetical protein
MTASPQQTGLFCRVSSQQFCERKVGIGMVKYPLLSGLFQGRMEYLVVKGTENGRKNFNSP